MKHHFFILFIVGLLSSICQSQIQTTFSGSFENEILSVDGPSPALHEINDETFYSPRFSLSLNSTAGEHWIFHATVRGDRGFNAGNTSDGEVRLDEVFLRHRSSDHFNIQIGKTATIFGAWAGNHNFYDSAFLSPPLPYGEIRGISVLSTQALSSAAISGRNSGALPGIYENDRSSWAASIWGPAYTTGISAFSNIGKFDYAFELKNVSPGSSPD